MNEALTECCAEKLAGALSCYDRAVIMGTLPPVRYAGEMTLDLVTYAFRIVNGLNFVRPLRERVRGTAVRLAACAGITIEKVTKAHIRREDIVTRAPAERGDRPRPVRIISAMETCVPYQTLKHGTPTWSPVFLWQLKQAVSTRSFLWLLR